MVSVGSPSSLAFLVAISCCGVACGAQADAVEPQQDAPVHPRDVRGCANGDVTAQRRGTDCLCCHTGEFSVAGTIFGDPLAIKEVRIEDAVGASAVMAPNGFGNFFRHNVLVPPLRVSIVGTSGRTSTMALPAPEGACNRCHAMGGAASPLRAP